MSTPPSTFRTDESTYVYDHAVSRLKSLPDCSTDEIMDGAFAGWDAKVYIPEPGVDPFEGIDDEDLLNAHAGVVAAVVLAQSNQMRILDSAIVPDRDLVRPTADPQDKFNEFEVYTPLTTPERYSVINEAGEEEVVIPSEKYYPGQAERPSAVQSAVQLGLEDETNNPYVIAMATGTALLQIGIEAGRDVAPVAEILNRAWGGEVLFSPGTVVGLQGAHDYPALFSQDRNTNARRLASWQNCSYVRSGQLNMERWDWGTHVHCDFRRIRVAAESMFATTMAIETTRDGRRPRGKVTYHVPATSLLSCDPQYLFFQESNPGVFPIQDPPPAAKALLSKAVEHGLLPTLWPKSDPEIKATWSSSFDTPGALVRLPVKYEARQVVSGPIFAAATARVAGIQRSMATGMGRTVMTTVSAKIASMVKRATTIQVVAWASRFAAVIEILRLSTSKDIRVKMAKAAWRSLSGDIPRDLERSLSTAHMTELKRGLPAEMRKAVAARSAKVPIWAVLLEVGNPKTQASHTVLRGLRYLFNRSQAIAKKAHLKEKVEWKQASAGAWLEVRLSLLREFWAVQFAALSQVAYVAVYLRSDLRWWIEVSSAVNWFRAGVMRGYAVAKEDETAVTFAGDIPIRCRPYHAAARLRKDLEGYFPAAIPPFHSGEWIADWAYTLTTVTAPYVATEAKNIPRVGRAKATADHTSHFTRGAFLLEEEGKLSQWVDSTTTLVAEDCEALLAQRVELMQGLPPRVFVAPSPDFEVAVEQAGMKLAEALGAIAIEPPLSEFYEWVESQVPEDAWDNFLEAEADPAHPNHSDAARQLEMAKHVVDKATARSIANWIVITFTDSRADSAATIK